MSKRIILLAAAIFALAVGAAFADDHVKGPFAGTVHAVASGSDKDGNAISVTWDRGKITTLGTSSITLTRRDEQQVTFAITGDTVVRNEGATYQLSDLKTGLVATVLSQNGNAVVIRRIRGDGAPSGVDQSEFEGPAAKAITGTVIALYYDGGTQTFDYNRGRIQSVGNGTLTLIRRDRQSVTLGYDSSTLVREGDGRVGSVEDLKPGDRALFFSQSGLLKLVRHVHGAPRHVANGRRGPRPRANAQAQNGVLPTTAPVAVAAR